MLAQNTELEFAIPKRTVIKLQRRSKIKSEFDQDCKVETENVFKGNIPFSTNSTDQHLK